MKTGGIVRGSGASRRPARRCRNWRRIWGWRCRRRVRWHRSGHRLRTIRTWRWTVRWRNWARSRCDVSVRRVAAKDVGAFRRLLHTHHPLGWDRSPGAALNCWIVSSRQGRLGGVRWSAASWHQACRDRWIGWSEAARVAHLQAVVRQSRFLILPGVRVPNLASHVLAKASKALAAEWRRARGTAPLLEYTYVDPSRAGTCYRAAGWQRCAGRTSGRPPGGRRTSLKAVWVHPLSRHWRRELCAESGARLPMWSGSRHGPIQADWADRE